MLGRVGEHVSVHVAARKYLVLLYVTQRVHVHLAQLLIVVVADVRKRRVRLSHDLALGRQINE